MTSRFFLGRLSAWMGRGRLLTGSCSRPLGMALLSVPMPVWLLCRRRRDGLGLGAGQPLTMSWLAEATPPACGAARCRCDSPATGSARSSCRRSPGSVAVGTGAAGVLWLTAAA